MLIGLWLLDGGPPGEVGHTMMNPFEALGSSNVYSPVVMTSKRLNMRQNGDIDLFRIPMLHDNII